MPTRIQARLVAGERKPYTSWTFVEVPADAVAGWGPGAQFDVRVGLAGQAFHGRLRRAADGAFRVAVTGALLEAAGHARGDRVEVTLARATRPEPALPKELRAALDDHPAVAQRFAALAPSMRRAWIDHVAEAKRPETRRARAGKALAGIRSAAWPR